MMRKVKFMKLLMIGLSAAIVFTGCKKDDEPDPKPTISVTEPSGGSSTVTSGDDVTIAFTASSEIELRKVLIDYKPAGGTSVTLVDSAISTNSFTFNETFTAGAIGTEVYTITVKDKNDNISTSTITITVTSAIKSFTAKMMGGQSNTTVGSYMTTQDASGTVYFQAAADADPGKIDLIYFYGTANEATLGAATDGDVQTAHSNVAGWSVKNATKFKTTSLNSANFDALVNSADLAATASGASASKANMLAAGDILGFITAGGKSGAIRVVSITGTGPADRAITIDVKVQE